MKIYTFGEKNNKKVLLLPGLFMNWKENFNQVIELLTKKYFVCIVSYDGFDNKEKTTFENINNEVIKIEKYINESLNGNIDIVYGSAFGGNIATVLFQRKIIKINELILGSPKLEYYPKVIAKIKTSLKIKIFKEIRNNNDFYNSLKKNDENDSYIMKTLNSIKENENNMFLVSDQSMYNQYLSSLNTKFNKKIKDDLTKVHIFFSMKMGEKYLSKYVKIFENPDIIYQNYRQEELLLLHPDKWFEEFERMFIN